MSRFRKKIIDKHPQLSPRVAVSSFVMCATYALARRVAIAVRSSCLRMRACAKSRMMPRTGVGRV
ncbi:MAG: hypothetical protein A3B30_01640 [Candidatus Komeilibacteria bacterium RIFCSPLOWO2_01_FULL_52_15]|uniref:Uncharacterized protein n=2 Tax=Candidatus Komeiliibacteriota TaxID=1817908 RepID=A0A1G2BSB7_9BACT|nr:MAG: hypothetical protein A2677_00895 [Candidatus Komeilibacteria bacterium RIFCSPHIGHO2_01_FULL_52_14]OGY92033.1 MAG: hypothetical protein A3B30_01640 [Candidatus Komeilibacteria bacterium RIFCSPLOWO2_01_FULL_52_15]